MGRGVGQCDGWKDRPMGSCDVDRPCDAQAPPPTPHSEEMRLGRHKAKAATTNISPPRLTVPGPSSFPPITCFIRDPSLGCRFSEESVAPTEGGQSTPEEGKRERKPACACTRFTSPHLRPVRALGPWVPPPSHPEHGAMPESLTGLQGPAPSWPQLAVVALVSVRELLAAAGPSRAMQTDNE